MLKRARKLLENARELRDKDRLREAGNAYTAAAHEYQGTVEEHTFPGANHPCAATQSLCCAATCYRINGDEQRLQNRSDLGILLAEDYIEYIDTVDFDDQSFADLRRGAWPEFIGDLRTIAQRDNAADAYDRAASIYQSAGYWEFCMSEEEHMRLASFFVDVRRGLGHEIPEDALEKRPLGPTFSEWIAYKREQLPDLLDELEGQGEWPTGR